MAPRTIPAADASVAEASVIAFISLPLKPPDVTVSFSFGVSMLFVVQFRDLNDPSLNGRSTFRKYGYRGNNVQFSGASKRLFEIQQRINVKLLSALNQPDFLPHH